MTKINTIIQLDDMGLFKNPRKHEQLSQYQRAVLVRDGFAECMTNALNGRCCVLPGYCADGKAELSCIHLRVDYLKFVAGGIPLTKRTRALFDERLRAIGTLVYREQCGMSNAPLGVFPGDIHIPSLQRISQFTGTRRAPRKAAAPKRTKKSGGWLSRLFG